MLTPANGYTVEDIECVLQSNMQIMVDDNMELRVFITLYMFRLGKEPDADQGECRKRCL